ncbi:Exoenzyme S synthesis regulatory protein ExsA [Ensifer adhaerens]|uniref:AraC family transcriptional regulator n=1 Tax=Ensifer adhaerens TaxID=106592 RepID=UPI001F45E629|nr:AraC family transcriptional regulator [Ensifer adhaerens]NRP20145.1 Exoenzyme S synthesis regulatory protein ExsA [Ensifer adhaerens]
MGDLEEFQQLMERNSGIDGVLSTKIPHLILIRSSNPTEPIHTLHKPAVCFIAQGSKQVMLGDTVQTYDPNRYLTVSVDLPVIGQVIDASAEKPYLCLRLDLDPAMLSALVIEMGSSPSDVGAPEPGLFLSDATPELLDAIVRLLRLLDRPDEIAVLAPLAEREILYRLLVGEQGHRLRQIARAESKLTQVNRAIDLIKRDFRKPLRIEDLAARANMGLSSFHQHFKAVTAMSPLQYQKQLRLQEARRLILGQSIDAATAGHHVGYDSPSQFSREYARLFGAPPLRDIARLRAAPSYLLEA